MTRDIQLACRCGEIQGRVRDVSPSTVNRVVCYCEDCQAFLHHLGRAELLDARGGTDITQVAPASVSFERGQARITGLRLSPKGLYRWYASCCKTPLGNTVKPSIPFVGIGQELFRDLKDAHARDEAFGRPRGAIFGQHAVGGAPEGSTKVSFKILAGSVRLIGGWKLRGKTWPHPFFDRATGDPSRPLTTLSKDEREALRAFCGPNPSRVPTSSGDHAPSGT